MRPLSVPVMTDKELAESMKWEVERYVPFRPEDTQTDFKRLPPVNAATAEANEMSVLLVAAQRQMVDNLSNVLLSAGLTPVAIDVEPLSLLRTVPLHEVRENCVAVVNIGASKTDIGVFDRGILVYPRSFPIAGDNLTRGVADSLGLPTEQAERLKVEFGQIPEERSQAASVFDTPGGFGAFDLPETGFGAPEEPAEPADDFGLGGFTAPEATPAPAEPDFGGFAAPVDDDANDGGIAFHLDDEDTPASSGGFAFSLDDEPVPSTPAPAEPTSAFSFAPDPEPAAPANEPFGAPANEPLGATPEPALAPTPAEMPVPVSEEDRQRRRISDSLVPVYNDLAMEIRRSLEYYVNRPGGRAVTHVYLSGGTARMKGLAHALEQDLGIPVHLQDPSRNFSLTGKNAQPGYYAEVGPVIALAIGLGIRDLVPDAAPEIAAKPVKAAKAKAA
jgi:Tfp pilus assembly PilM family ATPase